MSSSSNRPSHGGGVLIAVGALAGAFIGVGFGESTRGFLGGVALGALLAGLLWWRERGADRD